MAMPMKKSTNFGKACNAGSRINAMLRIKEPCLSICNRMLIEGE